MAELNESVLIQSRPDTAWEFLSDMQNITRWYSRFDEYGRLDEGILGMGSKFYLDWELNDRIERFECWITIWKEQAGVGFHASNIGLAEADFKWWISEVENGVKVDAAEKIDFYHSDRMTDRLFVGPEAARLLQEYLDTLKKILEN